MHLAGRAVYTRTIRIHKKTSYNTIAGNSQRPSPERMTLRMPSTTSSRLSSAPVIFYPAACDMTEEKESRETSLNSPLILPKLDQPRHDALPQLISEHLKSRLQLLPQGHHITPRDPPLLSSGGSGVRLDGPQSCSFRHERAERGEDICHQIHGQSG